jgi:hypothetical protein
MLGSATIRAHGCTIYIYRQCCVVRAPCVNVICSSCSRTQLLVTLPADIWMREIPAPLFFLLSLFFPLPRYTPRTATIGRMKKKERKKLLYNLPLLPNSFPPIVSRCLGFFPVSSIYSLLSILYWGRIATALRARNLSWRSYPTQRIAI